ncbi:uncharacterized protein N7483_002605 [Penicillium malachiteum]|uniref:uncharacterized protein n=1 Tax=Penicillium malachiteum TaxID=1324776 RepID=UPI0025475159|nr:uncharacterized protein N7483_002605 [Penicillium malachiteum]KAJ5737480.1 hypothetical protein N7483_002605 [Penicillium malachiteum]
MLPATGQPGWPRFVTLVTFDPPSRVPTLPMGSTGPATRRRRTVLPWYVRIREDHSTLDTPESGTWEKFSAAHIDLMNTAKTPSGLTSKQYAHVPHSFPAAVHFLHSLGDFGLPGRSSQMARPSDNKGTGCPAWARRGGCDTICAHPEGQRPAQVCQHV